MQKITKKTLNEIQPESAKNTIVNQHKKFGKIIGVNGYFGSSNLGQKTGGSGRPTDDHRCICGFN